MILPSNENIRLEFDSKTLAGGNALLIDTNEFFYNYISQNIFGRIKKIPFAA